MSLTCACSHCGTRHRLSETLLGRKVRCKKCQRVFRVTELAEDAEASAGGDDDKSLDSGRRGKAARSHSADEEARRMGRAARRQNRQRDETRPSYATRWIIGGSAGALLGLILILFLIFQPSSSTKREDPAAGKRDQRADSNLPAFPKIKANDPVNPSADLKAIIDRLDQSDPGWRLVEIERKRPAISADKNGALRLANVCAQLGKGWKPAAVDWSLNPFAQLEEAQLFALRAELKQHESAVGEARKLTMFPTGRFQVVYGLDYFKTPAEHVGDVRNVVMLLSHDAVVRCHDGHTSGALDSWRAALHATRYLNDEPVSLSPLMIMKNHSMLVACMERILTSRKTASPEQLLECQRLLDEEGNAPRLYTLLRADRAGGYFLVTNVHNGDVGAGGTYLEAPFIPHLPAGLPWYLEHMTQAVEIARGPLPPQRAKLQELSGLIAKGPIGGKVLLPAYTKMAESYFGTTALVRAAVVALAAERFRNQKGQWPSTLDKLVPDFIKSVPSDPYTGSPFKGVLHPERFMVYCQADGTSDQGGTVINQNSPSNLGFHILDPSRRR